MSGAITIRPLDAAEWRALRDIRLFALQTEPGVFFASYDGELALPDDEWRRRIAGAGCVIFGLFAGDDLIGITGVVTDRDDPTGKTAVLVMSYIRPAYRGRGLTALLYEARLNWIASQPQFTRTIMSHRASNEAPRARSDATASPSSTACHARGPTEPLKTKCATRAPHRQPELLLYGRD